MPTRPQKWKELSSSIPIAHRQFVLKLREMRDLSDRTQAQIAQDVYMAPTSLSNHLNGGRIPEAAHVEKLYKVLDVDATATARRMPCSLDFLLGLRAKALIKHCECCSVGFPSTLTVLPEPKSPTVASPARQAVQGRARRLRIRHYRHRHPLPGPSPRAKVPVPLPVGDRHLTAPTDEAWPEISALAESLAAGRARDADVMMWSAATTLSARNLQVFVDGCRSAGLDEAADQVITNAARRDAQAVLNIAAAFHQRQRYADASRLLAAAAQPE